ncbi:hypothetical protein TNCV_1324991 [Trichonephila clavipes]|nr:hypothetical protein TNCV_1324991 [Trichonephila clavipes]
MWTRSYGALGQTARVCFGVLCANKKKEEVKRDFGDLRIRRSEGRVVNTPLVVKKGSFSGDGRIPERKEDREKKRRGDPKEEVGGKRRRKDGKERERRRKETERESGRVRVKPALNGGKGLSPEIGVKKTMNAGGVE